MMCETQRARWLQLTHPFRGGGGREAIGSIGGRVKKTLRADKET